MNNYSNLVKAQPKKDKVTPSETQIHIDYQTKLAIHKTFSIPTNTTKDIRNKAE
jgi:hypothetical protein